MSKGYSGLSSRGGSSGIVAGATKSIFQNAKMNVGGGSSEAQASKAESKKKMPTSGAKVQKDFIEYVQKQTGVNLEKARDTQFDTRSYFNIDTSQLSNNDWRTVQSLMRQYDGGYDVTIADNGATRKAIYVKRKKK